MKGKLSKQIECLNFLFVNSGDLKLKKQATSDVTGYTYNLENKTTNRIKSVSLVKLLVKLRFG